MATTLRARFPGSEAAKLPHLGGDDGRRPHATVPLFADGQEIGPNLRPTTGTPDPWSDIPSAYLELDDTNTIQVTIELRGYMAAQLHRPRTNVFLRLLVRSEYIVGVEILRESTEDAVVATIDLRR